MRTLPLLGACLALSCGGSASEAPWPAEPIDLEPGPAGETRKKGLDTSKLPDNYTKKKQKEAPEEQDETIEKEEAPPVEPEEGETEEEAAEGEEEEETVEEE